MIPLGCAVCYAAKDEASNWAFLMMTGFMTLFPLAVLGGLIYLFVRRVRAIEALDEAEMEASREQREA